MARPVWKGSISFGLVNIPVTLYSGEKKNDLSFHLLDSRDKSRVRYVRINESTGEEVPWNEIVKGYEYDGGDYVLLRDQDFQRAAVESTKSIDLERFVPAGDVDLAYIEKPYFLEPGKRGEKGYVLLREALRDSGRAGLARVVIRTRQYLALLAPRGDMLALYILRYEQEVRGTDELDLPEESLEEYKVTKQELKMAATLVESMADEWNPEEYHDDYREQLIKYIEERIERGEIEQSPEAGDVEEQAPEVNVVEMMSLLKESMEKTKKKAPKKSAAKRKKVSGEH